MTAPARQPAVFVTGGSGYVGRNLIRHFVARGMRVVALARSGAAADTVRALGAEARAGDLHDERLAGAMAGCDLLVHAAADTDHGRGGARQHRTNVDGTAHVLACARAAGVTRAVHVSTESVLLDGRPLVDADERHPFPARPAGGYSRTKGAAERIALALSAPGFTVTAVRPRFVWGRDDTTALPQLMKAATSGRLAWIDGGHYLTSTTHVANLCHGVELALQRGAGGQAYFVTDGAPVPFRRFVTDLLATQGIAAPDKRVPRWLVRGMAGLGDALRRCGIAAPVGLQEYATMAVPVTLDIGRARRELGYVPVIAIDAGMAELRRQRAGGMAGEQAWTG